MGQNIIGRGSTPKPSVNTVSRGGGSQNVIGRGTVGSTSKHGGGGGIFGPIGGVLHSAEHAVHNAEGTTQHALGSVADKTASIGTGLYAIGKAEGQAISDDLHGRNKKVNNKEWSDLFHGHPIRMFQEAKNPANHATPAAQAVSGVERAIGSSYKQSAEHPLRDPVSTALNALPLVSAGLSAVGKAAYLGRVANAGRVAETGDLVDMSSPAVRAAREAGHTVTPLSRAEKAALARKVANPRYRLPASGRTLNVPKLIAPAGEGPASLTHEPVVIGTGASTGIGKAAQVVHDKVLQKALDRNVSTANPSRAARYAGRRVAGSVGETAKVTANVRKADVAKITAAARNVDKGVGKQRAQLAMFLRSANVTGKEAADYWRAQQGGRAVKLAKLAQSIHDSGVLHLGSDGNVAVDATRFPKLAAADKAVKAGQDIRENILAERGLMSPEGMRSRLDLVGQKMLGETARPGQGFVSLKTSQKTMPQSGFARARGKIIPKVKPLSVGKKATGKGVAPGLIPASTSGAVARGLNEALRFVGSDELRGGVARLGSDVKRTGQDVLIRDPAADKAAGVPVHIKQMLGQEKSTLDMPSHDSYLAVGKRLVEHHIPGLADKFARDQAEALGTRAPQGFKWVPKQMLPDELTTATEARGRVEKFADAVNSAVTSATVYMKLGHLPTRLFTNASTNVIQGSLAPGEIGKNVRLAHALTDEQKMDLLAATGTHGYQALPHEGTGTIARIASSGASLWARKVDAPFRLNAILHELRNRGFDTPEKIDQVVKELKNPGSVKLSASQLSKLHAAVRESNRASIMYDGLSAAEKRYVARYMWFYPWTKGAVRFAGRTAIQHPLKAADIGQIGNVGSSYRNSVLGPSPGYELNLTPFTKGYEPLTGNLSSYTPFSTIGDVAQIVAHPLNKDEGVMGQANPYYAALVTLLGEAYAGKKHAWSDAVNTAVQPTPEFQAVSAYRHPPNGLKMFGSTPLGISNPRLAAVVSALLRGVGGAAVPRPTNRAALAKAAQQHPLP